MHRTIHQNRNCALILRAAQPERCLFTRASAKIAAPCFQRGANVRRALSNGLQKSPSRNRIRSRCYRGRGRRTQSRGRSISSVGATGFYRRGSGRHRARLDGSSVVDTQAAAVDYASHHHALGHWLDRAARVLVQMAWQSTSARGARVRLCLRRPDAPAGRLAQSAWRAVDCRTPFAQLVE